MPKTRKFLVKNKAALAVIFIPIIFLGVLISLKAVNAIYWDEWELAPIFQHIHAGHLYFNDFWQQHNEHRLLFPTAILVALDELTHWNVVVECFASFLIALASFLMIFRMLKFADLKSKKSFGLLFLLSLIWFSPVQVENWLWGWQLEWFLSILGVVVVGLSLSMMKGAQASYKSIALLLSGAIIAQFSLANGTLVWPLVIVLLLYKRVPLKRLAIVVATGALTSFLYYRHYITPQGAPSRSLALHEPAIYIKYVLLYLGRPLSFIHGIDMIFGLLLLVAFLGICLYLLFRHRAQLDRSIPWIFLGLYAVASAIVTGLARLGFGVYESTSSRYTTVATLLLISTIVLYWQNADILKKSIPGRITRDFAAKIALPIVFIAVVINAGWGIHSFSTRNQMMTFIKQCTHQTAPSDTCLLQTYPSEAVVKTRLQYLQSVHWAGY